MSYLSYLPFTQQPIHPQNYLNTTPQLDYIAVIRPCEGESDAEQRSQIIFFVGNELPDNDKVRIVGLVRGMEAFGSAFAQSDANHTVISAKDSSIIVTHPELDFVLLASIRGHVSDHVSAQLSIILEELYEMFKLLNAPFSRMSREALTTAASEYFNGLLVNYNSQQVPVPALGSSAMDWPNSINYRGILSMLNAHKRSTVTLDELPEAFKQASGVVLCNFSQQPKKHGLIHTEGTIKSHELVSLYKLMERFEYFGKLHKIGEVTNANVYDINGVTESNSNTPHSTQSSPSPHMEARDTDTSGNESIQRGLQSRLNESTSDSRESSQPPISGSNESTSSVLNNISTVEATGETTDAGSNPIYSFASQYNIIPPLPSFNTVVLPINYTVSTVTQPINDTMNTVVGGVSKILPSPWWLQDIQTTTTTEEEDEGDFFQGIRDGVTVRILELEKSENSEDSSNPTPNFGRFQLIIYRKADIVVAMLYPESVVLDQEFSLDLKLELSSMIDDLNALSGSMVASVSSLQSDIDIDFFYIVYDQKEKWVQSSLPYLPRVGMRTLDVSKMSRAEKTSVKFQNAMFFLHDQLLSVFMHNRDFFGEGNGLTEYFHKFSSKSSNWMFYFIRHRNKRIVVMKNSRSTGQKGELQTATPGGFLDNLSEDVRVWVSLLIGE